MIKSAINRILELSVPNVIDQNGRRYVDKNMNELDPPCYAKPLEVHTLSAIMDYIRSGADKWSMKTGRFVLHVEDFNQVHLYRELDDRKKRDHLLSASSFPCAFPFGRWMELEHFIIQLQTSFVATEALEDLASLAGNIVSQAEVSQKDDGITQQVTVKDGISLVRPIAVKNPVILRPYCTFTDIDQPEGNFVFRLQKTKTEIPSFSGFNSTLSNCGCQNTLALNYGCFNAGHSSYGITAALFSAGEEEWKRQCILGIRGYFVKQLTEKDNTILLA